MLAIPGRKPVPQTAAVQKGVNSMSGLRGAIVPVTPFQQNCAILWDDASKTGMVVDPGGDVDRILAAIDQFKPRAFDPRWTNAAVLALFVLVSLNAAQMLRERPLVYVEGTKIIEAHRPYELEIPPVLRALLARRPDGVLLMITSTDPQIIALTGIPLRQTINESDLQFYRDALAAPAAYAALVLAFDGDEIDQAVRAHPQGLTAVGRFSAPGQPAATLYVSGTPGTSIFKNRTAPVIASLQESP